MNQAAEFQQSPIALVSPLDNMVLFNSNPDRIKLNMYRGIVNQRPIKKRDFNVTLLSLSYCSIHLCFTLSIQFFTFVKIKPWYKNILIIFN